MQDIRLTVLTPTYNRKEYLKKLYGSICCQTYKNIEWVVVSDGSTDGTSEYIKELQRESQFEVKFIDKENGGKPSAHNAGIEAAESDLTVICDDDDYFVENAFQKMIETWEKYQKEGIGGIIGYRGSSKKKPLGGHAFPECSEAHLKDIFANGKYFDTVQIYRTDILKLYKFPITPGEKFVPEVWLWNEIDKKYKLLILPEVLEICEYLQGGMTKSGSQNMWNNPVGYSWYFLQKYQMANGLGRIKYCGAYIGLRKSVNNKTDDIKSVLDRFLSFPVAFFVYAMRKRKGGIK